VRSVSVIVPTYNCGSRLSQALDSVFVQAYPHDRIELVIVDDGSTDETVNVSRLKAPLHLVRTSHQGKGLAIIAGCRAARSDTIVTIDADLQEFPEQISLLLSRLAGADFIQGIRAKRKDQYFAKRAPSRVFNWLIALLFGRNFGDINCGFRAFRKNVLVGLDISGGRFRLLPLLAFLNGHRVQVCAIDHRPRRRGAAKFNSTSRYLQGVRDLISVRIEYLTPRSAITAPAADPELSADIEQVRSPS